MSITAGGVSICASAAETVAENSRSAISSLASPWPRMKAMVAGSSRVLSAFRTAPAMGTPKCASINSGVLAAITATVSPSPMPRRDNAEANRRQRSWVCRQVRRTSPWITAIRSGNTEAVRGRKDSGDNGT